MELSENPFIKIPDYYAELNENIQKLKNHPNALDFEKLCYELFEHNDLGKKFIKECEVKFLIPALAQKGSNSYPYDCIWAEGFKEFIRMIKVKIMTHQQRIKSEMNKK